MVGVILPLFGHPRAAHVGAVIARAGDDVHPRAVRADHVDLLWGSPLGDEYLAVDAHAAAVGGDAVARVAAGILHDGINADRLAVRDEHRRAAVFKRERGHIIIHFQQEVIVKAHDGGHSLAECHLPPRIAVKRHERAVAEDAPLVPVDERFVKRRQVIVELPQPAAGALFRPRRHIRGPAAF